MTNNSPGTSSAGEGVDVQSRPVIADSKWKAVAWHLIVATLSPMVARHCWLARDMSGMHVGHMHVAATLQIAALMAMTVMGSAMLVLLLLPDAAPLHKWGMELEASCAYGAISASVLLMRIWPVADLSDPWHHCLWHYLVMVYLSHPPSLLLLGSPCLIAAHAVPYAVSTWAQAHHASSTLLGSASAAIMSFSSLISCSLGPLVISSLVSRAMQPPSAQPPLRLGPGLLARWQGVCWAAEQQLNHLLKVGPASKPSTENLTQVVAMLSVMPSLFHLVARQALVLFTGAGSVCREGGGTCNSIAGNPVGPTEVLAGLTLAFLAGSVLSQGGELRTQLASAHRVLADLMPAHIARALLEREHERMLAGGGRSARRASVHISGALTRTHMSVEDESMGGMDGLSMHLPRTHSEMEAGDMNFTPPELSADGGVPGCCNHVQPFMQGGEGGSDSADMLHSGLLQRTLLPGITGASNAQESGPHARQGAAGTAYADPHDSDGDRLFMSGSQEDEVGDAGGMGGMSVRQQRPSSQMDMDGRCTGPGGRMSMPGVQPGLAVSQELGSLDMVGTRNSWQQRGHAVPPPLTSAAQQPSNFNAGLLSMSALLSSSPGVGEYGYGGASHAPELVYLSVIGDGSERMSNTQYVGGVPGTRVDALVSEARASAPTRLTSESGTSLLDSSRPSSQPVRSQSGTPVHWRPRGVSGSGSPLLLGGSAVAPMFGRASTQATEHVSGTSLGPEPGTHDSLQLFAAGMREAAGPDSGNRPPSSARSLAPSELQPLSPSSTADGNLSTLLQAHAQGAWQGIAGRPLSGPSTGAHDVGRPVSDVGSSAVGRPSTGPSPHAGSVEPQGGGITEGPPAAVQQAQQASAQQLIKSAAYKPGSGEVRQGSGTTMGRVSEENEESREASPMGSPMSQAADGQPASDGAQPQRRSLLGRRMVATSASVAPGGALSGADDTQEDWEEGPRVSGNLPHTTAAAAVMNVSVLTSTVSGEIHESGNDSVPPLPALLAIRGSSRRRAWTQELLPSGEDAQGAEAASAGAPTTTAPWAIRGSLRRSVPGAGGADDVPGTKPDGPPGLFRSGSDRLTAGVLNLDYIPLYDDGMGEGRSSKPTLGSRSFKRLASRERTRAVTASGVGPREQCAAGPVESLPLARDSRSSAAVASGVARDGEHEATAAEEGGDASMGGMARAFMRVPKRMSSALHLATSSFMSLVMPLVSSTHGSPATEGLGGDEYGGSRQAPTSSVGDDSLFDSGADQPYVPRGSVAGTARTSNSLPTRAMYRRATSDDHSGQYAGYTGQYRRNTGEPEPGAALVSARSSAPVVFRKNSLPLPARGSEAGGASVAVTGLSASVHQASLGRSDTSMHSTGQLLDTAGLPITLGPLGVPLTPGELEEMERESAFARSRALGRMHAGVIADNAQDTTDVYGDAYATSGTVIGPTSGVHGLGGPASALDSSAAAATTASGAGSAASSMERRQQRAPPAASPSVLKAAFQSVGRAGSAAIKRTPSASLVATGYASSPGRATSSAGQGAGTSSNLGSGGLKLAEWHENCTLLFADVVGFTSMASICTPEVVMDMLNQLYSRFDALCAQLPACYKLETIGDCYIVVTGLLAPDARHVEHALKYALAMRREASRVAYPHTGLPVQVRIGVHSGRVMSGVVGQIRRKFTVIGDVVNTASRMESTGEPGRIHVSAETHSRVAHLPHLVWSFRGPIEVKGKGLMETWWLEGEAAPGSRRVGRATAASMPHRRGITGRDDVSGVQVSVAPRAASESTKGAYLMGSRPAAAATTPGGAPVVRQRSSLSGQRITRSGSVPGVDVFASSDVGSEVRARPVSAGLAPAAPPNPSVYGTCGPSGAMDTAPERTSGSMGRGSGSLPLALPRRFSVDAPGPTSVHRLAWWSTSAVQGSQPGATTVRSSGSGHPDSAASSALLPSVGLLAPGTPSAQQQQDAAGIAQPGSSAAVRQARPGRPQQQQQLMGHPGHGEDSRLRAGGAMAGPRTPSVGDAGSSPLRTDRQSDSEMIGPGPVLGPYQHEHTAAGSTPRRSGPWPRELGRVRGVTGPGVAGSGGSVTTGSVTMPGSDMGSVTSMNMSVASQGLLASRASSSHTHTSSTPRHLEGLEGPLVASGAQWSPAASSEVRQPLPTLSTAGGSGTVAAGTQYSPQYNKLMSAVRANPSTVASSTVTTGMGSHTLLQLATGNLSSIAQTLGGYSAAGASVEYSRRNADLDTELDSELLELLNAGVPGAPLMAPVITPGGSSHTGSSNTRLRAPNITSPSYHHTNLRSAPPHHLLASAGGSGHGTAPSLTHSSLTGTYSTGLGGHSGIGVPSGPLGGGGGSTASRGSSAHTSVPSGLGTGSVSSTLHGDPASRGPQSEGLAALEPRTWPASAHSQAAAGLTAWEQPGAGAVGLSGEEMAAGSSAVGAVARDAVQAAGGVGSSSGLSSGALDGDPLDHQPRQEPGDWEGSLAAAMSAHMFVTSGARSGGAAAAGGAMGRGVGAAPVGADPGAAPQLLSPGQSLVSNLHILGGDTLGGQLPTVHEVPSDVSASASTTAAQSHALLAGAFTSGAGASAAGSSSQPPSLRVITSAHTSHSGPIHTPSYAGSVQLASLLQSGHSSMTKRSASSRSETPSAAALAGPSQSHTGTGSGSSSQVGMSPGGGGGPVLMSGNALTVAQAPLPAFNLSPARARGSFSGAVVAPSPLSISSKGGEPPARPTLVLPTSAAPAPAVVTPKRAAKPGLRLRLKLLASLGANKITAAKDSMRGAGGTGTSNLLTRSPPATNTAQAVLDQVLLAGGHAAGTSAAVHTAAVSGAGPVSQSNSRLSMEGSISLANRSGSGPTGSAARILESSRASSDWRAAAGSGSHAQSGGASSSHALRLAALGLPPAGPSSPAPSRSHGDSGVLAAVGSQRTHSGRSTSGSAHGVGVPPRTPQTALPEDGGARGAPTRGGSARLPAHDPDSPFASITAGGGSSGGASKPTPLLTATGSMTGRIKALFRSRSSTSSSRAG